MMTTKRLLDVCDFQGGTQPPKDEWINDPCEGYVRMLQIRDYSQGDAKFIQYVKDTKKLHKCTKDDIMLSRYGYIGQAFIGLEGAYNVALVKVIKKAEIHTPYLLCYFQSYYFQHFLLSNVGARATIPGFNKDELENALIRIPEMCEQIEIASKITKVDELIGFHKQQLNVLDTLIKSRFIELFGAISEEVPLSYYIGGLNAGKSLAGEEENPNKVLKTGAATYDYFDETQIKNLPIGYEPQENHRVKAGDVIISRMNTAELVGAAAYVWDVPEHIYLPDRLWRAEVKETANPIFVWQVLIQSSTKESIRRIASGTSGSMKNISKPGLLGIRVVKAPIKLQEQFAAFVGQVDKSKFEIQQSLEKLEILKKSLMQQYFG